MVNIMFAISKVTSYTKGMPRSEFETDQIIQGVFGTGARSGAYPGIAR